MTTETQVLSPEAVRKLLAEPDEQAQVLDLRDPDEFAEGHIVAALNAPDADVDALPDELAEEVRLVVVCEDGERSAELAAKLSDSSHEAAALDGGMKAWRSAKLPQQPSADFEAEPKDTSTLPGAGV